MNMNASLICLYTENWVPSALKQLYVRALQKDPELLILRSWNEIISLAKLELYSKTPFS